MSPVIMRTYFQLPGRALLVLGYLPFPHFVLATQFVLRGVATTAQHQEGRLVVARRVAGQVRIVPPMARERFFATSLLASR